MCICAIKTCVLKCIVFRQVSWHYQLEQIFGFCIKDTCVSFDAGFSQDLANICYNGDNIGMASKESNLT